MNRAATHVRSPRGRGDLAFLGAALVFANSVASADEIPPFRTGILPLLTKAGCNAGACHGAATGQGGFKLSLLGYDPEEDYERITRERGGRRIDRSAPAESLLLRKPSGQLEHEGGRRLPRHSEAYQKLERWIKANAPYGPRDLRVASIAVSPEDTFLPMTNRSLSLRVRAELSDGSREDVTALALYSSNDDAIAEVGKQGDVRVVGRGVTSIMIRYSGQVAAARVAVPFSETEIADDESPAKHWIDQQISAELKRLRLPRSPLSSDTEFLRRVHLDLIGRLPTTAEARAFLREGGSGDPPVPSGDPPDGTGTAPRTKKGRPLPAVPPVIPFGESPNGTGGSPVPPTLQTGSEKRQRIIDALLQREEFVDFWTMRLADLLLISGKRGSEEATRAYHEWLRAQVARNTPFDELARTLLTASGKLTADARPSGGSLDAGRLSPVRRLLRTRLARRRVHQSEDAR